MFAKSFIQHHHAVNQTVETKKKANFSCKRKMIAKFSNFMQRKRMNKLEFLLKSDAEK